MENISLRTACISDAKDMLALYSPYVEKTAISFEYTTPSLPEFEERITSILSRFPWIIAEKNKKILGYAYASPFHSREAYRWCAEVSIYVDTQHRQQGIGSILYASLERILRQQNVMIMYACIAKPTQEDAHLTMSSMRFHQKMSFIPVGEFPQCGFKFGTWYDIVWMEKRLFQPNKQPSPLVPFPCLLPDIIAGCLQDTGGRMQ